MSLILKVDADVATDYHARGYWRDISAADFVRKNAQNIPTKDAIITEHTRVSWAEYDAQVDQLAGLLGALLDRDDRFVAYLPDSPEFHYALCAAERSGTIAVGVGARSEYGEVHHLFTKSVARVLLMRPAHKGVTAHEIANRLIADGADVTALVIAQPGGTYEVFKNVAGELQSVSVDPLPKAELEARAMGPNELSMLNSTSGTTGRPKLVTQFANKWYQFVDLAVDAAELTSDDVILGAVPSPFGFGLWTAHYAPAVLGVPVVVMESFSIKLMIELIEREKATMLACVSTQFKMMLDALDELDSDEIDVSSLRVMFTGGEAVPYERARDFEDRIGAAVLQFYGSNEGGAVTYTTLRDSAEKRLRTAGRLCEAVDMVLLDGAGNDVTGQGVPGQPAVKGPTITLGYFNDEGANKELFKNGMLLMPDIVTVDEEGYYRIVGRTSDLIIRGGKNISAVEVEEAVEGNELVKMAAAVPVPDELFGERIGVAVELVDPATTLTLEELVQSLIEAGVAKTLLPEHLLVVDELPLAPGGKIAKGKVKELFK